MSRRPSRYAWAAAASSAAAVVLYAAASRRLGFIYDDQLLILEQAPPRSFGAWLSVFWRPHWFGLPYYRPIAWLTLTAQKLLHGNAALPFHLFNAALSGIAGFVAFGLLRRPEFRIRDEIALLAGSIFMLHPIASSAVYPITARETSMVAILMTASVLAYLRGGIAGDLLALGGLAAALLTREQAAVLPLLFVSADLLRSRANVDERGFALSRRWRFYLAAGVVLTAYALIRKTLFGGEGRYSLALADDPLGPLWSILYALQSTFAPFGSLVYEPRLDVWMSSWRLAVAALAVSALVVAAWRAPADTRRAAMFWGAWFVVALLPTANLVKQETRFDERYLFLSLLGAVGASATLASSFAERARARRAVIAAGAVALVACASVSLSRARFFVDNGVFLRRWVQTDPGSYQVQLSLGEYEFENGRPDEAWRHLQEALRISPAAPDPHNVLGHILAQRGDLRGAVSHYETLLRAKPDYAKTHSALALTLALAGDFENAQRHCARSLALQPDLPGGHFNCGYVLELSGRLDAAWAEYALEASLGALEGLSEDHAQLGDVFAGRGLFAQARRHFEEALRLDPGNAHARSGLDRLRDTAGRG